MKINGINDDLRDVPKLQAKLKSEPESYWIERGEKMALRLFHEMAERVPAYKDFLKSNKVNHEKIKDIKDFQSVPTVDKDNYLRKYPRNELCWDGKFADESWVISTTSGSTGKPFYFPRTELQDEQYAITAELYLRENFQIHKKTTLYIDAFAMGAWIGGLFTYEAVHRIAQKGYPLSIITPGVNKVEIINSVINLGKDFEQVIIGSYPPFMRDIIDYGKEQGINWSDYNLGVIFSAEGFGEDFRNYIIKNAGLKDNYLSSLNHYGTVDLGTMSHETGLSVLIRDEALKNNVLYNSLFGDSEKLPTHTQYLPEHFYFEEFNSSLICSSYSGFPLVRYDLRDQGGVITLEKTYEIFRKSKLTLNDFIENSKISNNIWNLPFVYIYERNDLSLNLAGGVIYPEEIKKSIYRKDLHKYFTGKFTMEVNYENEIDTMLIIHIELKSNVEATQNLIDLAKAATSEILLAENSEYASNFSIYGDKILPTIKLYNFGHEKHFSGRGKQKWVKN